MAHPGRRSNRYKTKGKRYKPGKVRPDKLGYTVVKVPVETRVKINKIDHTDIVYVNEIRCQCTPA